MHRPLEPMPRHSARPVGLEPVRRLVAGRRLAPRQQSGKNRAARATLAKKFHWSEASTDPRRSRSHAEPFARRPRSRPHPLLRATSSKYRPRPATAMPRPGQRRNSQDTRGPERLEEGRLSYLKSHSVLPDCKANYGHVLSAVMNRFVGQWPGLRSAPPSYTTPASCQGSVVSRRSGVLK